MDNREKVASFDALHFFNGGDGAGSGGEEKGKETTSSWYRGLPYRQFTVHVSYVSSSAQWRHLSDLNHGTASKHLMLTLTMVSRTPNTFPCATWITQMFLQQIHNLISRKLTDEKCEQYFKQWKDLPPFVLMGSLRTKVEKKRSIKIFKNKPLNLPHKGSRTSLLLQWQSQPPASIFTEEKNTWSFLFEKLYYSATLYVAYRRWTIQLVFTGQLIPCTQQMLDRVSNTVWEDTLVPTCRVEDTANCYQLTILQPSSHSPASPTSRLFKKQRKQNHTQSHHHLAASASTRFWHARYWQPQRPIFLFLCCCFKSKARVVIWKHKHADRLTLWGRQGRSKCTRTGNLPCRRFRRNGTRLENAGGDGYEPGNASGLPDSCHNQRSPQGSASDAGVQKDTPTGARYSTQGSQLVQARRMWAAMFS